MSRRKPGPKKSMAGIVAGQPWRSPKGNTTFWADFSGVKEKHPRMSKEGWLKVVIIGPLARTALLLRIGDSIVIQSEGRDWALIGSDGIVTTIFTKQPLTSPEVYDRFRVTMKSGAMNSP